MATVYDTLEILEDGSGIYTKKIYIDKLFNVVSTWEKTLVGASTTRWYCGLVPAKLDGSILMSSIPVSSDIVNDDRVCVGTYGNASALHIRVPNSITTSQQVTEYIKTNYPDEYIAYKLATPIIIHIPKELVPTILIHKNNILEAGGAVKPSSFKVTVPTTDGIKKEYTLTPINGWKGTAKANLLQTGDIGLVLDLTIPSSFNASICSLATELRPKAERTVLGYNGNTPVVVKIGTDGTVKLPISTTGTVKLDDTYKL